MDYNTLTDNDIEKLKILQKSIRECKDMRKRNYEKYGHTFGIRGKLSEKMRKAYKEVEHYGR